MNVVEPDVKRATDTGMDIDIDIDINSDQPFSFSALPLPLPTPPTKTNSVSASGSSTEASLSGQAALDGTMDVDATFYGAQAAEGADHESRQSLSALTPSVPSPALSQTQSQPRALAGSQSLPAPASPSSSPSPPPSPSPLTPQNPHNRTSSSALSSPGTTSTFSSSASSAVHGEAPPSRTMSTLASPVAYAAPPLDGSAVPATGQDDVAGALGSDVAQDDDDGHSIPAVLVDKGKGKEKPDEGGEQEEEIVITNGFFNKADFDFDWDEEADRFYNGEYDDEFGGYYEDEDEDEDDSDFWDSEEDEYSDEEEDEDESESEEGKEKKKSKIKVLDEFGFDMLSFARMLIESGEMEKIQREARQTSPTPLGSSSVSTSPTPEPLDPDFPEIDDMDDVSIEEINKQLKGLKIVKFERISENAEKFTFDWTDSGGEEEEGREKEKELKEVQETNVPRLVVTDASPPQSPVRRSTALPSAKTPAPLAPLATSTSSIRPPSSSFTFTFTLPLSKLPLPPPQPFPAQSIPASERLQVPPV
ncbi:hypothetical protein CVT26_008266, partial [Gymnopilus dilepis]